MSLGEPRPLAEAQRIAEALLVELLPACARIEIAGSVRRKKPTVSDIEIVAVPLYREEAGPGAPQGSLFASPVPGPLVTVNCLWERIEELSEGHRRISPLKPGSPGGEADNNWAAKRLKGSRYFRLWLEKPTMKVDLFLADAETWGLILAIRTGSALFSQALVTHWTQHSGGGHAREGRLTDNRGRLLSTPEEADVFRLCGLQDLPPEERIDGDSLVRA